MGNIQQISIGIICLVAAFLFGRYVNTHPDPDQLTHAFSDLVEFGEDGSEVSLSDPGAQEQRPAPMETMRNRLASRLPMLKSQTPGQTAIDLPPPSELAPAAEIQPTATMPNLVGPSKRREIVVPDFSRLAAEFKNTPLELPPIRSAPGGTNDTNVRSDQTEDSSRLVVTQPFEFDPPRPSIVSDSPSSTSDPALASTEDNPRLAAEFTDKNPVASDPALVNNRLSKIEPPPMVNTMPPNTAGVPPSSVAQTNSVPINAVRSLQANRPIQPAEDQSTVNLNDTTTGDPNSNSYTVLENPVADRGEMVRQKKQDDSIRMSAKPRIPFGLTDDTKTQLVKIRRPQSSAITLGTTDFKTYRSVRGDTLQKISTRFYGRPDFYLDIYLANQKQLRNPAELPTGLLLKIPIYN